MQIAITINFSFFKSGTIVPINGPFYGPTGENSRLFDGCLSMSPGAVSLSRVQLGFIGTIFVRSCLVNRQVGSRSVTVRYVNAGSTGTT